MPPGRRATRASRHFPTSCAITRPLDLTPFGVLEDVGELLEEPAIALPAAFLIL